MWRGLLYLIFSTRSQERPPPVCFQLGILLELSRHPHGMDTLPRPLPPLLCWDKPLAAWNSPLLGQEGQRSSTAYEIPERVWLVRKPLETLRETFFFAPLLPSPLFFPNSFHVSGNSQ